MLNRPSVAAVLAAVARPVVCAGLVALCNVGPVSAHQIDEYVAVTHIELTRARVRVFESLTPGSDLASGVIASVDTDGDGRFSESEQWRYASRFVSSLTLAIDDSFLTTRLVHATFPEPAELRTGQGIIRLDIEAFVDGQAAGQHKLILVNQAREITVSVANALIPPDPDIRIRRQNRDAYQRHIEIEYDVAKSRVTPWVFVGLGASLLLGVGAALWYRRSPPPPPGTVA